MADPMAGHSEAFSDEFHFADFGGPCDASDTLDTSDDEDIEPNFRFLDILVEDTQLLAREHEEISKMTFSSEEDAYSSFNSYAKGKGKFVNTHNHVLARSDEVCFLRSHRKIQEVTKAKILAWQLAGLRKHQIMDVLEQESCGYQDAGMTAKDLYNFAYRVKIKKISDGDAKTVLKYQRERSKRDPDFFFKHEVDSDGHLTHLLWADAQSRIDYKYFGDVLVFDSTYRVNLLLLLVTGLYTVRSKNPTVANFKSSWKKRLRVLI